jgi:membrane-associated phospholipid phosphatase
MIFFLVFNMPHLLTGGGWDYNESLLLTPCTKGRHASLLRIQGMNHLPNTAPSQRTPKAAWMLSFLLVLVGLVVFNSPWNQAWLLLVHASETGPAALWSFLTQFGEGGAAFLLLIVAAQFAPLTSAVVLKSFLLGSLLSPLLKNWAGVPRPLGALEPSLLKPIGTPAAGSNAMPSGHAMTIAATIALAMYMTRHFKHRRPLWVALVVLGVLIALSRVVVGAHWPADILVGSGLGIMVALLAVTWEQRSPWSPRLQTKPFQLVLLLVELGLVLYLFKAKTDTEAARLAFDLIATVGIAGAMNRWICLRREAS